MYAYTYNDFNMIITIIGDTIERKGHPTSTLFNATCLFTIKNGKNDDDLKAKINHKNACPKYLQSV